MNSDLTIVLDFLELTGPEVTGRQTVEPELHVAELLERFARGECDADERADVCNMLRLNPAWLHWLASRVVLARGLAREEPEAAAG
jgi:hypothetical protein